MKVLVVNPAKYIAHMYVYVLMHACTHVLCVHTCSNTCHVYVYAFTMELLKMNAIVEMKYAFIKKGGEVHA